MEEILARQEGLKYLYENIKDGDSLVFYCSGLKGFFIKLFTGGDIMHVAKVYNVANEEQKNTISFEVSDLIGSGGRLFIATVTKKSDKYITTKLGKRVSLLSVNRKLHNSEIQNGYNDAIEQVGKKYGTFTLWRYINWVNYLLPKKIIEIINNNLNEQNRVCSLHCLINDFKLGLVSDMSLQNILKNDIGISPTEYAKMSYFKDV